MNIPVIVVICGKKIKKKTQLKYWYAVPGEKDLQTKHTAIVGNSISTFMSNQGYALPTRLTDKICIKKNNNKNSIYLHRMFLYSTSIQNPDKF